MGGGEDTATPVVSLVKWGRGLSKGDVMRMMERNLADFNGQIGAMFRLWALKSLNSEIKY